MSHDHSSDYEDESLLAPIIRLSKEIESRIRTVHDAMDQLHSVTKPYSDLAEHLRAVAQNVEKHRTTIAQLRTQNESLRTDVDKLNDSLRRSTEEKRKLIEELNSERREKGIVNSQALSLASEREVLMKEQRDARLEIAEFRERERKLHEELSNLRKEIRAKDDRIGQLELHIRTSADGHKLELEQRLRDSTRKMEDQKIALDRQYMDRLHSKIEECESEKRDMKRTFENALKQTEFETKKLETERNLYYTQYQSLKQGLEERKRKINSDAQRLMSEKWREMIEAFNSKQAAESVQGTSSSYMIRRPEYIAKNFLKELDTTPSESSTSPGAESEEFHINNENIIPIGRAATTRKRSASSGPHTRQPLSNKAINTHANTELFRTATNGNHKKTHKK